MKINEHKPCDETKGKERKDRKVAKRAVAPLYCLRYISRLSFSSLAGARV